MCCKLRSEATQPKHDTIAETCPWPSSVAPSLASRQVVSKIYSNIRWLHCSLEFYFNLTSSAICTFVSLFIFVSEYCGSSCSVSLKDRRHPLKYSWRHSTGSTAI